MDLMQLLMMINTNKFIAGLAMIAMNFGSRFLLGDLSKLQEEVLKTNIFKTMILFCIFFVSTRDLLVSLMLTFAFQFVIFGIFNENKPFNIFKSPTLEETTQTYNSFVNKMQSYTKTI